MEQKEKIKDCMSFIVLGIESNDRDFNNGKK